MREYDEWRISEAREWLAYARGIQERIESADGTLEVIRRLAEPRGIDYTKPVVSHSVNVDAMADVVASMDELSGKWRDERIRLMAELDEVMEVISKVDNVTYRDLLVHRYVAGECWESVGASIHYDGNYANGYLDKAACLALHSVLPPGWRTQIPKSYK